MISHYNDRGSAQSEWLAAAREWETEGERTPAQSEPSDEALDIFTPALLRKQAA